MASQTDLGKWMITNGGEYSPDATYEQLTMVLYKNSTYITLRTVSGVSPQDDRINYILMAQGFSATALSDVTATDTQGVIGNPGETVSSQSLVDYLTDAVINKLIKKIDITNIQVNDKNKVPSAALVYAQQQELDQLNSNFEVLGKLQVYYNTTVGALAFNLIVDGSTTTYGVKFDNSGITYSKNVNGTYATTWIQNNQMIANIFSGDVYTQVKAQINSGKRTGIMYFTNASSGFPSGFASKIGYIEFFNHNNTNFVALRCYSNSLRPVDGQMSLNSSGITWYT